jgi:tetratricopeptide (TPR) repeat protein
MPDISSVASPRDARRRLPWLSLWPGLAQIWAGQEWLGLMLAIAFAANLNLALLTRALWNELAPPMATGFFSSAAALTWLAAMAYTLWWTCRLHPALHEAEAERLYREALVCYLQGRWHDARMLCEQALARNEADADTLLQLALTLARLGQPNDARRALRECAEHDAAGKWRWEIDRITKALASQGQAPATSLT